MALMIPKFIYISVNTRSCEELFFWGVSEFYLKFLISRICCPQELSMINRIKARLRSMGKVI